MTANGSGASPSASSSLALPLPLRDILLTPTGTPALPPYTHHDADLICSHADSTPSPLSGSQDLLDLFELLPLYETYVRPYVALPSTAPGSPKGKEREPSGGTTTLGFSIAGVRIGGVALAGNAAADDKAKKAKMDKTYTHLVADIPGRNTIKKDKHLRDCVLNPDIQPVHIQPFDASNLRGAFSLKTGAIPGFDAMIWETEVDVPKRKKKKRKHDGDGGGMSGGGGTPGASASMAGAEDEHRKKKKRKGDEGSPSGDTRGGGGEH